MNNQISSEDLFGGEDILGNIGGLGEPHMAVALLLDVSGSMYGEPMGSLNKALRRFKESVCKDPLACKRVDVAIVTFGTKVLLTRDFTRVVDLDVPVLNANGYTHMAEGIQVAIDLVKQKTDWYHQMGVPCFKPWIFMITDGISTSSDRAMKEAADRIHMEENKGSHGRLSFWALGIGEYDSKELFQLTNRVIELKDCNFEGIFDWLSESMTAISNSHVDDKISIPNLPDNARKAQEDRRIDEGWL